MTSRDPAMPRATSAVLAACALACALLAAGCTIDRRSDGFACKGPQDCAPGRSCEAGWCVTLAGGDASTFDAPVDLDGTPDGPPFVCPASCTRCEGGICIIECSTDGSCSDTVVCPAGVPCNVRCNGQLACQRGVNCTQASSCAIECTNGSACIGNLTCGKGRCDINCTGASSCTAGIDCGQSCACDVRCIGGGTCSPAASCPGGAACDTGPGCTSEGAACNKCQ